MVIDPNRVNLCERDIEDYLFGNPGDIDIGGHGNVEKWIKRQMKVPSGIIDLLGVTNDRTIVVVEVKNVPIDSSALAQVSRYALDVRCIKDYIFTRLGETDWVINPHIVKVVVGKSIDHRVMLEAESMGVHVITFEVNLSINASRVAWPDTYIDERERRWQEIGNDPDLILAVSERIALFTGDDVTEQLSSSEDHQIDFCI